MTTSAWAWGLEGFSEAECWELGEEALQLRGNSTCQDVEPGTFQGNPGGKWSLSACAAEAWCLTILEEEIWAGLTLLEY